MNPYQYHDIPRRGVNMEVEVEGIAIAVLDKTVDNQGRISGLKKFAGKRTKVIVLKEE